VLFRSLSRVITLQRQITVEEHRKRIGARAAALVDGPSKKNPAEMLAHTAHDEQVIINCAAAGVNAADLTGKFVNLTLDSLSGNTFRAKEIELCGEQ
jgi:tRNA A37 methylthiotransferase MiaB